MEISPGIEIIDTALWIKSQSTLIINDLHLGYEESLHHKGVMVPRFQLKEIIKKLETIFKQVSPQKIIINGDLKHEFGKVLRQESREVFELFDFMLKYCPEIIVIKGNHDLIVKPLADKKNIKTVKEYRFDATLVVHGDTLVETNAKRIIIGHEHPAVTIREASKKEKYKCFLKGKWKRKELIVLPSFNPLLEGTDVLKEELLSPFLNNINNFEVYIINEGEVFSFGKIKELQKTQAI